jgi:hypothetical protein
LTQPKTTRDDGAPVVVGKAYDFALWLLPKVESFPRSFRFTLGERLSGHGLDILSLLTEAAYATSKDELLAQANRKINSARLLLRLAADLKVLSRDAYAFAAERLDEIGRMTGGWRKAARA